MEDGTNFMLAVLASLLIAGGLFMTVRNGMKVRRNRTIRGEIYDRRCMYQDAYFPVIKYEVRGETRDYTSTHRSVLQRIGSKMTLVYDEKRDRIVGTMGELFFMPVTILVVGLFLAAVMFLYAFVN